MEFETSLNFVAESNGQDPDRYSPTLRSYHKLLWSKRLPSGNQFVLTEKSQNRLYHNSELGEFVLGSDCITHSYKNRIQDKMSFLKDVSSDVEELFDIGSLIGAYTIFPNNRIGMQPTINGMRGMHHLVNDRFDLTLECIRRHYLGETSPLYETLMRYKDFFDLFDDFKGYIEFFLLQDLVDKNGQIKFYLPFDHFKSKPGPSNVDEYLIYKEGVTNFVNSRNKRMEEYIRKTY